MPLRDKVKAFFDQSIFLFKTMIDSHDCQIPVTLLLTLSEKDFEVVEDLSNVQGKSFHETLRDITQGAIREIGNAIREERGI